MAIYISVDIKFNIDVSIHLIDTLVFAKLNLQANNLRLLIFDRPRTPAIGSHLLVGALYIMPPLYNWQ